jgi:hypothetical protein
VRPVLCTVLLLVSAGTPGADAQTPHIRPGLSAGMGVSYVSPGDVVDLINAATGQTQRTPTFTAGVEFFGACSVPVAADWAVKVEYAYLLAGYNVSTPYGPAEYTISAHMPTLFLQYILLDRGIYNVKIGAGAGYHVGSLETNVYGSDIRYSGKGIGVAIDLDAATAFGEDLYAYLGADMRWELIGALTDAAGDSPGKTASGGQPALHLFGIGARLGFTYYF